ELLRRGDRIANRETVRLRKGCATIDVAETVSPIRGPGGDVVGMAVVVRDIRERESLAAQFRQAQKMEAVGRLAGGVAHDFNNLLTAIMGYSDLLLVRLRRDDPLRHDIEEIRKAGVRAASLTRQLLVFSRHQVLELKVLDLNAIVSDMERMLRRLIGEDVDLRVELAHGLGQVKADAGQIEQVILNLSG